MLIYESTSKSMNQPRSQFFPTWLPLFWARTCLLYMHESSLSTYLHIPLGFHNQRPCNGYRELYSGQNIDFILKNHCPIRPFFLFLWCSTVRFDWIKIGVWLKLGALNYSSRPKLPLGSAHVKYDVWPRS